MPDPAELDDWQPARPRLRKRLLCAVLAFYLAVVPTHVPEVLHGQGHPVPRVR